MTRRLSALPVLLSLLALAACSGKEEMLEPSSLPDFVPAVKFDRLWSVDSGAGGRDESLALQPAVDGQRVYTADAEGRLVARERASGRKSWRRATHQPFSAGPVAAYGQVFVGTREGELLAYAAADGELLWRVQLGGEVLAPPAVNGDAVAVKTADGHVTLLDRVGGVVRWVYDGGAATLSLRSASRPLLLDDAVLVGLPSGELLALERGSGQLIWQRRIAEPSGKSELDRLVDIAGDFVLADDRLYVASYQGRLVALDLRSGQFVWQQPLSSFRPVALAGDRVFVVDADARVHAVRSSDGVVLWRSEALLGRRLTGAAPLADWILVGDLEGWVHVIAQADGAIVGRRHVNGLARWWRRDHAVAATPLVDEETVYALDRGGRLGVFRVEPRMKAAAPTSSQQAAPENNQQIEPETAPDTAP